MSDPNETARRAMRAFEHAGNRLAERGVDDAEIGKAMVAAGLSRWSRAISAKALAEQLAGLTLGVAAAAGLDHESPRPPEPYIKH